MGFGSDTTGVLSAADLKAEYAREADTLYSLGDEVAGNGQKMVGTKQIQLVKTMLEEFSNELSPEENYEAVRTRRESNQSSTDEDRAFVLNAERRRLQKMRTLRKESLQNAISQFMQEEENEACREGASTVWIPSATATVRKLPEHAAAGKENAGATQDEQEMRVAAAPAPTTRSGWLKKQGGGTSVLGRRNWKQRWVQLEEFFVTYRTHQEKPDLQGIFHVKDILDMGRRPSRAERPSDAFFFILTTKRVFELSASSEEDAEAWIASLRRSQALYKSESFASNESSVGTMLLF